MNNLEVEFEVVTLYTSSICGNEGWEDRHLNLNLYEETDLGRVFITSAVISRQEMLEFLGVGK